MKNYSGSVTVEGQVKVDNQPEISRELNLLGIEVECLQGRLATLVERLGPVLRKETGEESDGSVAGSAPVRTILGSQMNATRSRVERMVREVDYTLSLLEI